MIIVEKFSFNPFQENTFILFDETKECVIIDPGCYYTEEEYTLSDFIEKNQLKPVSLLLTHAHIDHVLGCNYILKKYGLLPEMHPAENFNIESVEQIGKMYGIPNASNPQKPQDYLNENQKFTFGNSILELLFVPGHSPGHLAFVCHAQQFVINGDVLFYESIGRTDLPGGDFDTLIKSIKEKMFALPDEYTVYCGHGPETSIKHEKEFNPFLN
ncbi:MAG: MBL fold metallo-hydrolase [Bacteroidetes bacterium]|nr:MBL fold metallo-hydrolase [Bacteroidota bacterium]MBV6460912.1 Hydroxyacylglutathione hydrolase GloC [Flavobacteriales bacterium]WKZ75691.1 MAG: MBL fold metallo-hydrolase [Vicingaceae bacterium]MCL4815257.1 MBL fold metallo-hydrolase [Flavobacteriales bacterium]NOG94599.1 MBL fold metallo-hydrolase [Bacteroidota bacterium]